MSDNKFDDFDFEFDDEDDDLVEIDLFKEDEESKDGYNQFGDSEPEYSDDFEESSTGNLDVEPQSEDNSSKVTKALNGIFVIAGCIIVVGIVLMILHRSISQHEPAEAVAEYIEMLK